MKKFPAIAVISLLAFVEISCASYRTVPLSRGVDLEGNIREFFAVAHNNVIVPEYVVNERGEYPFDKNTAWRRFKERQSVLVPKMKEKYKIPSDAVFRLKQIPLGLAFLAVAPVSYPLYVFSSKAGKRSVGDYFDLMVNGPFPKQPELKDPFKNF